MLTHLLHTSSPTIQIGLAENNQIIAREEFPADQTLAEVLATRIRALLQATSYQPQALERIVVHAGPGGFTALRIGVATANTLAYALGIPTIGVTGDVKDLDELLEKSKTAEPAQTLPRPGLGTRVEPAQSGIVTPVYGKPPNIGPVPLHLSF